MKHYKEKKYWLEELIKQNVNPDQYNRFMLRIKVFNWLKDENWSDRDANTFVDTWLHDEY